MKPPCVPGVLQSLLLAGLMLSASQVLARLSSLERQYDWVAPHASPNTGWSQHFAVSNIKREHTRSTAPAQDPQPSPDPKVILLQASEACKKIKTIEYTFDQEFSGDVPVPLPRVQVRLRQERADVPAALLPNARYTATGSITKPGMVPEELVLSFDGKEFRFLKISERAVLILKPFKPDQVVRLAASERIPLFGFSVFTRDGAFEKIAAGGQDLTYEGREEIDGVPCHVIAVHVVKGDHREGRFIYPNLWYIGIEDLLPRRLKIGQIQQTVRIIQINRPLTGEDFIAKTPDGFGERIVSETDLPAGDILPVGVGAPNWRLRSPDGREHSLTDYRGKIVVLDFWATWCVPCVKSMFDLQALHNKYEKRDVVIIGISAVADLGNPAGFMKEKKFTYGLMLGNDEAVGLYHAYAVPVIYVIGADGRVLYRDMGYREKAAEEIKTVIERNLKPMKQ